MEIETRLRAVLTYEFSGQRSFASCDIETRDRINKLVPKLFYTFGVPMAVGYKQRAERLSGLLVTNRMKP